MAQVTSQALQKVGEKMSFQTTGDNSQGGLCRRDVAR